MSATPLRGGLTQALAPMKKNYLLLGFLAAAGTSGFFWYNSFYGWHSASDQGDEFGLEFRYLGCSDWPENRAYGTTIQTSAVGSGITYHVSDPESCGFSVKQPKYKLAGKTLKLHYNYTSRGELAACICQYKSEFRFRTSPRASHVVFDHSGG